MKVELKYVWDPNRKKTGMHYQTKCWGPLTLSGCERERERKIYYSLMFAVNQCKYYIVFTKSLIVGHVAFAIAWCARCFTFFAELLF